MRNLAPSYLPLKEIDDIQRRQYELSNPKPFFAMCVRAEGFKRMFDDDKKGNCFVCEEEVYYRPYLADDINKICIQCFPAWMAMLQKHNDTPQ